MKIQSKGLEFVKTSNGCIYCGKTEGLSKSDIIPDALTSKKIINHNVCQIDHNNKFSEAFESKVIEGLAYITNKLDIKSSKAKKYMSYEADIIVGDTTYLTKISSDADLFHKKMSTEDGKTIIGPQDQIQGIAQNIKPDKVIDYSDVDVNQQIIEKMVRIVADIFICSEMHRLIAKIAYEWYCLHNDIREKLSAFNSIIDYIVSEVGESPVTFIYDQKIYEEFDKHTGFGSHTIMSYIAGDGSVNVLVSLFGIAIYNVRLLPKRIPGCNYNAIYEELDIEGGKKSFRHETINEVMGGWLAPLIALQDVPDNGAQIPFGDESRLRLLYSDVYMDIACQSFSVGSEDVIYNLLTERIKHIITTVFLTHKKLKRFIKEHSTLLNDEIKLNPAGTKEDDVLCYYALFVCGRYGDEIQTMNDLHSHICKMPTIHAMRDEMLKTEGYSDVLKKGRDVIEKKKFGKVIDDNVYVFSISIGGDMR